MAFRGSRAVLLTIAVASIFSLACHGAAVAQFRSLVGSLELPPNYRSQFYILLGLSAAMSMTCLLVASAGGGRHLLAALFAAHVLITALIGLPMGKSLVLETLLTTVLIVETAVLFDFPASAAVSGAVIGLSLAAQMPVSAWGVIRPAPAPQDIAVFAAQIVLLALALNLLRVCLAGLQRARSGAQQLESALTKLTDANIRFQDYAFSVEEVSTERERNRIAREIHDSTGYALTNIIMMIEEAQELAGQRSKKIARLLESTKLQAKEALSETRRALREMRNIVVAKQYDLRAIMKLVKAFESVTGVHTTVQFGDIPWSLGDRIDLAIYRMVQEGLTNAFKHGKATEIKILMGRDDQGVVVSVRDNGHGAPNPTEGIGLAGMRERIEQIHGTLKVDSGDYGFELSAWIPWDGT